MPWDWRVRRSGHKGANLGVVDVTWGMINVDGGYDQVGEAGVVFEEGKDGGVGLVRAVEDSLVVGYEAG